MLDHEMTAQVGPEEPQPEPWDPGIGLVVGREHGGDGLGLEEINSVIRGLKEKEEKDLKQKYRELEQAGILQAGELHSRVRLFLDRNYAYFIDKSFQTSELEELKGLAIDVANAFNRYQFKWYKKMLVEQFSPIYTGSPAT